MRSRALLWGLVAAVAYVAVASVSFQAGLFPARPLYDGTAPPEPYRFVDPPRELAETNEPPASFRQEFTAEEAIEGATIVTDDQQAILVFEPDGVEFPEGTTTVVIAAEPLDPDDFGPPPEGLGYEGNAYRFRAIAQPSGEPVTITAPVTVVLRFPFAATQMFRRDGGAWAPLESNHSGGFDLFTDTDRLGVFVNAGLPFEQPGGGVADWIYAAAGGLVVVVGVLLGRYRSTSKKRAQQLRMMGKKAKQKPKG